jgi:hypothetical protein
MANFKKVILVAGSIIIATLFLLSVDSKIEIGDNPYKMPSIVGSRISDQIYPEQLSNKLEQSIVNLDLNEQELTKLNNLLLEYKKGLQEIIDFYDIIKLDLLSRLKESANLSDGFDKLYEDSKKMEKELLEIKEAFKVNQTGNNFSCTKNESLSNSFILFVILAVINMAVFIVFVIYSKINNSGKYFDIVSKNLKV